MNRRTFITRTAVGSAVLFALGAGGVALRRGVYDVLPPHPLRMLEPVTYAVLVAVAARMCPFKSADPRMIAANIDEAMMYAPPRNRRDFRSALGLLENGLAGLATRGSITPFTRLPPKAQDEALHRWGTSGVALLRGAYQSFRKLCVSTHYASLEAGAEVGYPGPPFEKPEPPPIVSDGPLSPPFVVRGPAPAPRADPAQADGGVALDAGPASSPGEPAP